MLISSIMLTKLMAFLVVIMVDYMNFVGSAEIDDLQTIEEQNQQSLCPSPPAVCTTMIYNKNVDADNNSFFSSNNFPCNSTGPANISK